MRFIQKLPSQFTDKNSSKSAKAAFMKSLQKGSKTAAPADPEERYNEMFKEKLNEVRGEALKGAKYTFNLPGTDPTQCKELSKGAQEIIQKIAEKKAKSAEKKMKKADVVSVNAKYFMGQQGGRIDSAGKIYDSAGQHIMTVDKKSGKIKLEGGRGGTVGNYNPNSTYSEHRITELIAKHSTTNNNGWYAGGQAQSGGIHSAGGGVWGKDTNSCGNASIWGNTNASKDDNGGGWW